MYLKKYTLRTQICLFLAFTLNLAACEKPDPEPVKLDFGLKTHIQLIQDGKTGSARVQLRQLMENAGESAQPLFLMGLSYHKEKRYTKGVEWFEKAASFESIADCYPPTWHFLGWSYYYLGDVEKAQKAFGQFLVLHPDEGDSLFALGLLAMEAGNSIEAERLYSRSITAQKGNPRGQAKAIARLGDVHKVVGNLEGAKEQYLLAVKLDPDLYEAWYHLSTIQYRLNEKKLSVFALEQSKQAKERVLQSRHQTRFPE